MKLSSPLSKKVEECIKADLHSGGIRIGETLSIDALARKYGVSSTPVRDAINRLSALGYLDVRPRSKVSVKATTTRDFREVFEIRIALEDLAIGLTNIPLDEMQNAIQASKEVVAALEGSRDVEDIFDRHDNLIHELLVRYSGNEHLRRMMAELHPLLRWLRGTVTSARRGRLVRAAEEHIAIMKALAAGNRSGARLLLQKHLQSAMIDGLTLIETRKSLA